MLGSSVGVDTCEKWLSQVQEAPLLVGLGCHIPQAAAELEAPGAARMTQEHLPERCWVRLHFSLADWLGFVLELGQL